MKDRLALSAVLLLILAVGVSPDLSAAKKTTAKQPAVDLSAKPAANESAAVARYAWYLFLQAMKPANGSLAFESWTEQCQLNPKMVGCPPIPAAAAKGGAKGRIRVLHGSALRGKMAGAQNGPNLSSLCNPMTTAPIGTPPYPPPANVQPTATFCEEVYVNKAESTFVKTNGLITLSGQQTYGNAHSGAITFPWNAVEIKVDWVPVSSYSSPTFSCPDPMLYTETINGTCYALVGIHISSKVLPNWVWATFEPSSNVTNPNRCDPKLYDTCFDPWGTTSTQPYGKGQTAQQSQQLKNAMQQFGLDPRFNNYFLTGAETQFVNAGQPIPLGNSFVEFNAQVPPGQASCITCHKYAYYDGKQPAAGNPEDNFGGPPTGWASTGYACNTPNPTANCTPVVSPSTSQDFSWMLGLMP